MTTSVLMFPFNNYLYPILLEKHIKKSKIEQILRRNKIYWNNILVSSFIQFIVF